MILRFGGAVATAFPVGFLNGHLGILMGHPSLSNLVADAFCRGRYPCDNLEEVHMLP